MKGSYKPNHMRSLPGLTTGLAMCVCLWDKIRAGERILCVCVKTDFCSVKSDSHCKSAFFFLLSLPLLSPTRRVIKNSCELGSTLREQNTVSCLSFIFSSQSEIAELRISELFCLWHVFIWWTKHPNMSTFQTSLTLFLSFSVPKG